VISKDSKPTRKPWFGEGLSFSCTQCGNCCTGPSGYVWFDDKEAAEMAEHLGMAEIDFRKKYAKRIFGRWTLGEVRRDGVYDCVFLAEGEDGKRGCSIYSVRPTQCRTWPFWASNMRSRKAWDEAAESCPGMRNPEAKGKNFVALEDIQIQMKKNPAHL